jgi:hypothetical protein
LGRRAHSRQQRSAGISLFLDKRWPRVSDMWLSARASFKCDGDLNHDRSNLSTQTDKYSGYNAWGSFEIE